jgi:hypothetical protein
MPNVYGSPKTRLSAFSGHKNGIEAFYVYIPDSQIVDEKDDRLR